MYTFCSHWQYISQNSLKSLNYLSFRYSLFNKPIAFRTLYWAIRLFLSDSAREIFAANNKEFDWITSSVVLEPLSYSAAAEYERGSRTTLDVIQSNSLLLAAKISLAESERNNLIAQYNVLKAIGLLNSEYLKLK